MDCVLGTEVVVLLALGVVVGEVVEVAVSWVVLDTIAKPLSKKKSKHHFNYLWVHLVENLSPYVQYFRQQSYNPIRYHCLSAHDQNK